MSVVRRIVQTIVRPIAAGLTSGVFIKNATFRNLETEDGFNLLQASDWAALPDVPLTVEKRAEWANYRQALRDVTLQEDPFNITWPIQPS